MRSPVIAFSIFAAAAVSPALVGAAPTSPNLNLPPGHDLATTNQHAVPAAGDAATHVPPVPRELNSKHHKHQRERRVEDYRTAGGNAYSGASGNVSGGDTVNESENNGDAIANTDSSAYLLPMKD